MSKAQRKLMTLIERNRIMAERAEKEEQQPMTERESNGRFKKGSSGNPQGRPKRSDLERSMLSEIYKLAPQAVSSLKKLLEDEGTPCNVRLKAVEIVLTRICGTALNPDALEEYEDKCRFPFGSISESDLVDGIFDTLK